MAIERLHARTGSSVPDLDGLVVGSRSDQPPIRREGYRPDPIVMAFERLRTYRQ